MVYTLFLAWLLSSIQTRRTQLHDRSLTQAGFPNIKEPTGLSRIDGKILDGLALILWRMGRIIAWDATVTNTMASSYLQSTDMLDGSAA